MFANLKFVTCYCRRTFELGRGARVLGRPDAGLPAPAGARLQRLLRLPALQGAPGARPGQDPYPNPRGLRHFGNI